MKIFVLAGKASSGKDLVGRYMKDKFDFKGESACVLHITSPLYEYAKNYFSWNGDLSEKPREFFQEMGIEVIQNKLGKKFFLLDRLCEDIDILKNYFQVFIIADGRLISEFDELKNRFDDVNIIHIIREGYDNQLTEKEKMHVTEVELDTYDKYDYTIYNTSKEKLLEQVDSILDEDGEII
ncbi:MAG: hypothetical protein IKG58_01340 [Bacilli bacterium]|nr:hypothetical protein [Bacilli bacterium]